MRVRNFLIVMILAALGFQANAQRATYVHESYNSVREFIRPLQLSPRQVDEWSRLNRATDIAIDDIEFDRRLSPRAKARNIENILERHDRRLRRILSNRQLNRYYDLLSNNRGGRYNRFNNGRNNRRFNNGNYCPANYYDGGNTRNNNGRNSDYYDGRRNSRS